MEKVEKIIILAPHTDDGEFGCGGSISKFIGEGKEVFYVAFSTAEESVPPNWPKDILENEVKEATNILGIPRANLIIHKFPVRKFNYVRQEILDVMITLKNKINPELIFLPLPNDLHQDHQTIAMEGLRAFKQSSILGYEIPWNNLQFRTQGFIKLNREHIDQKVHALNAYQSQQDRYYATEDFIYSLAKTRGVQIGCEYAESFEVLRWIVT